MRAPQDEDFLFFVFFVEDFLATDFFATDFGATGFLTAAFLAGVFVPLRAFGLRKAARCAADNAALAHPVNSWGSS